MRRRDLLKTGAILQVQAPSCVRRCGRMCLTICGRVINLARLKFRIGSTRGHLALT